MDVLPQSFPVDTMPERATETLIRKLLQEFRDPRVSVSWRAAVALGRLESRAVVPVLVDVLKDDDTEMRQLAVLALGNMGEDAWPAVSALVDSLTDDDECVRRRAVGVLGLIGGPAAIPALRKAMLDTSASVRAAAAVANQRLQERQTARSAA
jgi:HEAT repeat protein